MGMDMNMFSLGQMLALLGAAMAAILAGIGSSIGVGKAGEASAGVVAEYPDLSGQAMILQLLPGTQGLYGFLVAVLVLLKTNVLGGMVDLSVAQGVQLICGCLPIAIGGLCSALYQSRVACCGINMLTRQPDAGGKAILMAVMVETYAVFALLASVLIVWFTAI